MSLESDILNVEEMVDRQREKVAVLQEQVAKEQIELANLMKRLGELQQRQAQEIQDNL